MDFQIDVDLSAASELGKTPADDHIQALRNLKTGSVVRVAIPELTETGVEVRYIDAELVAVDVQSEVTPFDR